MNDLPTTNISIVPGPSKYREGMTSEDVTNIAKYPADSVLDFINNYPDIRTIKKGDETWNGYHDWRWVWEKADRNFTLDFTLLGPDEYFWGGSNLETSCFPEDLSQFLEKFNEKFPATYVHDPNDLSMTPLEKFRPKQQTSHP